MKFGKVRYTFTASAIQITSVAMASSDLPPLIAADIRQILGGLTSVAKGIGALRTHGGSAHAAEIGQTPVDARIARFAIHSASTIALFLVETWERKQRREETQGKAKGAGR